jgi:hypothetical protein
LSLFIALSHASFAPRLSPLLTNYIIKHIIHLTTLILGRVTHQLAPLSRTSGSLLYISDLFHWYTHCKRISGKADHAELEHDVIELIAHKPVISGDKDGDWALEMENVMGSRLQGEYTPTNYPPSMSPASPAPLHKPPPITIYMPPPINYAPPPARHRPPRTHNMSQCPPHQEIRESLV